MKKTLILGALAAAGAALTFTAPAAATGKMTCSAPQAKWKSRAALETQLRKKGWKVAKSKVDGGCYEVYGTDPKGRRVEAYFHPVSFEQLLVSQRGKIIYKKK
ncbi:MAG TPA: PepSY domain-containing protein [Allosphingosinicella sp.]|jgi:hypothetical protein